MLVIKVSIIAIVGVVFCNFFKQIKGEYVVLIGTVLSIILLFTITNQLQMVFQSIKEMYSYLDSSASYLGILIKMLGICYLTEISSGICKDAGYQAISSQIVMIGKISMISLGTGMLLTLIKFINTSFGGGMS